MSGRPILFSAPMIRAILREIEQPGTGKTQTRRVFTSIEDSGDGKFHIYNRGGGMFGVPEAEVAEHAVDFARYEAGDRLYVREVWHAARSHNSTPPRDIPHDADIEYATTARSYTEIGLKGKLRPAMFLPRWASCITLTVTDVRVQRLQAISEADAIAEGIEKRPVRDLISDEPRGDWWFGTDDGRLSPVLAFSDLWDSINAKRGYGWAANPWVVAITFKPILKNIDEVLS